MRAPSRRSPQMRAFAYIVEAARSPLFVFIAVAHPSEKRGRLNREKTAFTATKGTLRVCVSVCIKECVSWEKRAVRNLIRVKRHQKDTRHCWKPICPYFYQKGDRCPSIEVTRFFMYAEKFGLVSCPIVYSLRRGTGGKVFDCPSHARWTCVCAIKSRIHCASEINFFLRDADDG